MDKMAFTENRIKVFEQMDDNSIMVIFSRRGPDVTFQDKYEINRNYYYLSGVVEYDNILVLKKKDGTCKSLMFIKPYDELKACEIYAVLRNNVPGYCHKRKGTGT